MGKLTKLSDVSRHCFLLFLVFNIEDCISCFFVYFKVSGFHGETFSLFLYHPLSFPLCAQWYCMHDFGLWNKP